MYDADAVAFAIPGVSGEGERKNSGFLTAKANTPVLTAGMIPIKYIEEADGIAAHWRICSTTDPEWFSYTARDKKWANVMLCDGRYNTNTAVVGTDVAEADLGSMFVWVPRYAYSIQRGYKGKESDGTIDISTMTENPWETNARASKNIKIQYLVGTTNTDVEGTGYNTDYDADLVNPGEVTPMITHPTFTSQTNYITGQATQLPGVWIAKFEASGTDSNGIAVGNYTNGGTAVQATDESTIVKSLPSKISWRHIQIGETQYQSTQMSTKTNYGWTANTVDTHLIKNSEWGSAAYMSYSRYGTVPMINSCGTTSPRYYDLYTGMGPASASSEENYRGSSRSGHEYNTTNGQLASTTGNTYGIYDMSGGSVEYTATYLDGKADRLYTRGKSTSNSSVIYFLNSTKELDSQYSALWEAYQVSSEERNNQITVEGVSGTLTKNQLYAASGSSYVSTRVQYNTTRKRLVDSTFNLMASKKGIGVNEVTSSYAFWGIISTGSCTWIQNATDTVRNMGSAWNQDYMAFGFANRTFISRGDHCSDGAGTGNMQMGMVEGYDNGYYGFRPAILPEEGASTNINITPSTGVVVLGNGNLTTSVYVTAEAGSLSASSSDTNIATASLSAVSNGTATLTVTPHAVGSATITVTEAAGGQTATYRVEVQAPNYQVASTGKYYNTLATAYAGAPAGGTINALQDATDTSSVMVAKDIILNLGTHTISRGSAEINVASGGTLTIYDGNINSTASSAITQTGGTVNIGRQADAFVDVDTLLGTGPFRSVRELLPEEPE